MQESLPAGSSPSLVPDKDLRKVSDGYLARWDRTISIAISKRLIRTSITPNQVTTASLIVGLTGAFLLARGDYGVMLAGGFLLWASCILDGCDGELARLKMLGSPAGELYDLTVDHIVNIALFAAIVVALHRTQPDMHWALAGLLLLSGVLLCMATVWRLILFPRNGAAERKMPLAFERLASRDFIYLLILFIAADKLDWFVWAAAIGSHLFWIALWLSFRATIKAEPA